jgi:hypothetical protein
MKLTTVHQLLIVGAIVMAGLYALRAAYTVVTTGSVSDAVLGVLAVVGALLAYRYLLKFRRKLEA